MKLVQIERTEGLKSGFTLTFHGEHDSRINVPDMDRDTEYALITERRFDLMAVCRGADQYAIDRLDDGDLSHIGDAVLAGRTVSSHERGAVDPFKCRFLQDANTYAVAPERIAIGGVSFPKPISEAPEHGTRVYIAGVGGSTDWIQWDGARSDLQALKDNCLHLSEKAAEEHSRAMSKLSGGVV